MTPQDVSVIIPTLNEAMNLEACIKSARACGAGEIIISDGGSVDRTREVSQQLQVDRVIESPRGRGHQLAEGLAIATGEFVLFLHADNQLDPSAIDEICEQESKSREMGNPLIWGAFHQRIDSSQWIYRIIEWGNAARVRHRCIAMGDQAVFAHRESLMNCGGIKKIPLMEDVELSKRLRDVSKPVLLSSPVVISARRWEETGVIRQTLRNWWLQRRFAQGEPAEQLAKHYRRFKVE